ncbi:MAG: AAA family ATPase [Sulfuricella sp.]|nr:AAA family ATPase [Sulfuricella sp.]
MKIAVISPNKKNLEDLGRFLKADGDRGVSLYEGGITRIQPVAVQQHPDVLILDSMCIDMEELAELERLGQYHPEMTFIMLCSNQSPDFLINAMRAGVREVLPSPVGKEAILGAIARIEQKMGLGRARGQKGKIVTLMPCKGGSGATFLAANIGYALAAQENKKVVLMDFNLEFGDASLFVSDHKPPANLADVALNIQRLDASLLASSLVHVLPNFGVLASPEDPGQAMEVRPEHIDALLKLAVSQYDYVILDIGRAFNAIPIKALDHTDFIFPVLQMTLPFIRDAKRLMSVFKSLGYPNEKVRLIVNRYQKGGDISLKDIEHTLGMDVYKTVPNSFDAVAASVNQGVPVTKLVKNNPVSKSIQELAQTLVEEQDGKTDGWWSRLVHRA